MNKVTKKTGYFRLICYPTLLPTQNKSCNKTMSYNIYYLYFGGNLQVFSKTGAGYKSLSLESAGISYMRPMTGIKTFSYCFRGP